MTQEEYVSDAVDLLKKLISTPYIYILMQR
jgi:hypothetical protein